MQRSSAFRLSSLLRRTLCAAVAILSVIALSMQISAQDLYLLTGTPTPNSDLRFGSAVFQVDPARGALKNVRDVVSKEIGVDFVEADYDDRLIVLGYPQVVPSTFAVVKMDNPTKETSSTIPLDRKSGVTTHYLLDVPGRGVGQALNLFDATTDAQGRLLENPASDRLAVIWLSGPPRNWEVHPWTDMLYVRCSGYFGTAAGSNDFLRVRAGSDGMLSGDILSGHPENLGIPAPPHLSPPLAKYEDLLLSVNNDEMAVISRIGKTKGLYGAADNLFVFSKDSSTWKQVSIPAGSSLIRGFRNWIAGTAAELDEQHLRQSPGREKRMAGKMHPGTGHRMPEEVSVEEIFSHLGETYFPGELFLYNAKTGKSYTISTGQGDSEVVLVTDNAVYYRVNDALYRVAVNSDSLGKPELLVKDPVIFQVHWAFLTAAQ